MTSTKSLNFIALLPSDRISREIKTFKEAIKSEYGLSQGLRLPAHITLQAPFWRRDEEENLLREQLRQFVSIQSPFRLKLQGFDHFSRRVIFVKVINPKQIISLQMELQEWLPDRLFLKENDRQIGPIRPHITLVSKGLRKNLFSQVFADFQHQEYSAYFLADNVTWFQHNGKTWDKKELFYFKGRD